MREYSDYRGVDFSDKYLGIYLIVEHVEWLYL